jgi:hypothetical protein
MGAWLWRWRISAEQLRAFISGGKYSHHEHALEVTATLDNMGGVEVQVRVVPEPWDEGPR